LLNNVNKWIGRSTLGSASICLRVKLGIEFAKDEEFVVHWSEGAELREFEQEWFRRKELALGFVGVVSGFERC